jgi:hypothetical protein
MHESAEPCKLLYYLQILKDQVLQINMEVVLKIQECVQSATMQEMCICNTAFNMISNFNSSQI